jgi:hypothetical protein
VDLLSVTVNAQEGKRTLRAWKAAAEKSGVGFIGKPTSRIKHLRLGKICAILIWAFRWKLRTAWKYLSTPKRAFEKRGDSNINLNIKSCGSVWLLLLV